MNINNNKEYDIIYADPPWRYNHSNTTSLTGLASAHYKTMTVEEICKLQVPAAKDSVLFLWATMPLIQEALTVMQKWNFKYKTGFVWVKNLVGCGFWIRGQHELLLVGKRGNKKTPLPKNRYPSVITARRKNHSTKPEIIYTMIERMFPNEQYLELFARTRREGWDAWGNEVPNSTQLILR